MNILTDFLTDIKAAWIVAGTSATTGTATFLDFIPDDIGKLATIISMALGLVLIWSHISKNLRECRLDKIDIILQNKQ